MYLMRRINEKVGNPTGFPGALSVCRYRLVLVVAMALSSAYAFSAEQTPAAADSQSTFYTYHDDWAIVSAPPPPGPYQAVNVDPRIPGQEDVMSSFAPGVDSGPPGAGDQLPEDYMSAPPAAGIPSRAGSSPYPGQGSFAVEPPPGYYSSRGFGMRRSAPVPEYPNPDYRYPQSGSPRYGYGPSPWSNAPGQRSEDEVPPPPLYNRMAAPPPPGYRAGPPPDQGYRRGIGSQ